eukprot:SAG31_NODE_1718_length_7457_cov_3.659418_1_plen_243_part_00
MRSELLAQLLHQDAQHRERALADAEVVVLGGEGQNAHRTPHIGGVELPIGHRRLKPRQHVQARLDVLLLERAQQALRHPCGGGGSLTQPERRHASAAARRRWGRRGRGAAEGGGGGGWGGGGAANFRLTRYRPRHRRAAECAGRGVVGPCRLTNDYICFLKNIVLQRTVSACQIYSVHVSVLVPVLVRTKFSTYLDEPIDASQRTLQIYRYLNLGTGTGTPAHLLNLVAVRRQLLWYSSTQS